MRREFPAAVKLAAWDRCKKDGKPHCEQCLGLLTGRPDYDHVIPDGLGGEPVLSNCQVLCAKCHKLKTHTIDRPIMTKADNQKKSTAGTTRKKPWPKRPFGGWQKPATTIDPDT